MRYFSIVMLLILSLRLQAQDTLTQNAPAKARSGIWVVPSGTPEINGLTLGLMGAVNHDNTPSRVKLNGLYVDVGMIGMFLITHVVSNTFVTAPFTSDTSTTHHTLVSGHKQYRAFRPATAVINGMSVIPGGLIGENTLNGLGLTGLYAQYTSIHGVSMSGFMTDAYEFKGVMISGIRNKATKGRGIQIALFNNCRDFRGLQIGLWNVNKKRSLPVINF